MNQTCGIYVKHCISAAHYIPDYPGACANMHGHTWLFEVWCENKIGADGFAIDFKQIKCLLNTLDHRLINEVVEIPTAENLCVYFKNLIPCCKKIRVWESEDCYAEISGE